MRVLVTGGAGYIGSVVVEQLLCRGYEVVVVDNLKEGHREAVLPEAAFYERDFGDRGLLDRIFEEHRIDAVRHFAADAQVADSMVDPSKYFLTNVSKGLVLLEAMRACGCDRMIFSSTAATFGEPKYTPIDENHPQEPINAYGESKLMFERMLDWYRKAYGLKFMSFRYFNAAGASERLGEDHRPETHLIPIVLQVALGKREYVEVYGTDYPTKDGTPIRDYIHVLDLGRAHILGLEKLDRFPDGKYNLGNGEGFSVLEVIRTAEEVTGRKIPYREAQRRPGDPAVLVASSRKAARELGWEPEFPELKEIIRSAWEWHRRHPQGYGP
ncbi:MAG: UDP-glucose 4-epimerase GalE [Candidatus Latescibacterota bacterium]|nr:MAG: UDP-glucose 4-epimerase GalE [Candidatus Latescibacterota bacterium]